MYCARVVNDVRSIIKAFQSYVLYKLGKICAIYGEDSSIENSNYATENPAKEESATFSLPLIVHPAGSKIYRCEMRKKQEGRESGRVKEREIYI